MAERDILSKAMRDLCHGPIRLFRNNTGSGWVGRSAGKSAGAITLYNPRPLHAGLCPGSSDTIGWTSVVVTPEMVGHKVAVFTGLEFKDKTKPTEEQLRFIETIRLAGGIAGIAHSTEEAKMVLRGCLTSLGYGGTIPTGEKP